MGITRSKRPKDRPMRQKNKYRALDIARALGAYPCGGNADAGKREALA